MRLTPNCRERTGRRSDVVRDEDKLPSNDFAVCLLGGVWGSGFPSQKKFISTLVWKLYEGNISQAMSSSIFWLNAFTFLYHSNTQLKCPHHGQGIGGSWLQSVRASCRAANGRGQLGNTVNKGWKPGDEILSARQNPLNPNTPTLLIRR